MTPGAAAPRTRDGRGRLDALVRCATTFADDDDDDDFSDDDVRGAGAQWRDVGRRWRICYAARQVPEAVGGAKDGGLRGRSRPRVRTSMDLAGKSSEARRRPLRRSQRRRGWSLAVAAEASPIGPDAHSKIDDDDDDDDDDDEEEEDEVPVRPLLPCRLHDRPTRMSGRRRLGGGKRSARRRAQDGDGLQLAAGIGEDGGGGRRRPGRDQTRSRLVSARRLRPAAVAAKAAALAAESAADRAGIVTAANAATAGLPHD